MPHELASVVKNGTLYERLQALADHADISLYALAHEVGISTTALYQMKTREQKGTQKRWRTDTANKLSQAIAKRTGHRPSEVYAYLTGLDETEPASA